MSSPVRSVLFAVFGLVNMVSIASVVWVFASWLLWSVLAALMNPNKYLMYATTAFTVGTLVYGMKQSLTDAVDQVIKKIETEIKTQLPNLLGGRVKEALDLLQSPGQLQMEVLLRLPGVKEGIRAAGLEMDDLATIQSGDLTPIRTALVNKGCPAEVALAVVAAATSDEEQLVEAAKAVAKKLQPCPITEDLAAAITRMLLLAAQEQSGALVGKSAEGRSAYASGIHEVLRAANFKMRDGMIEPLLAVVSDDPKAPDLIADLLSKQAKVPGSLVTLLKGAFAQGIESDGATRAHVGLVIQFARELLLDLNGAGAEMNKALCEIVVAVLTVQAGMRNAFLDQLQTLSSATKLPPVLGLIGFVMAKAARGDDVRNRNLELIDDLLKSCRTDDASSALLRYNESGAKALMAIASLAGINDTPVVLAAKGSGVDASVAASFSGAQTGNCDDAEVIINRLLASSSPNSRALVLELYRYVVAATHFGQVEEEPGCKLSFAVAEPDLKLLATAMGIKAEHRPAFAHAAAFVVLLAKPSTIGDPDRARGIVLCGRKCDVWPANWKPKSWQTFNQALKSPAVKDSTEKLGDKLGSYFLGMADDDGKSQGGPSPQANKEAKSSLLKLLKDAGFDGKEDNKGKGAKTIPGTFGGRSRTWVAT